MEDVVLVSIQAWMTAHPIAAARILGAVAFFLFVGNFCKAVRKTATARKWNLSPRQKVALDIGAMLGNVVWGLYALGKAFFHGHDPDAQAEPQEPVPPSA